MRRESESTTTEVVVLAIGTRPNLPSADDPADKLRELESKLDRCLQSLQMSFQPIVHAGTLGCGVISTNCENALAT